MGRESSVALIITDVLKDFCKGGALAVPNGDEVVEPINKIIAYGDQDEIGWHFIASRCWHPANSKHFKEFGGEWPVHGVANTPGAEFHDKLLLPQSTLIIDKGTKVYEDGYDAFPFVKKYFEDEVISMLLVCGLATDYCVKAFALSAAKDGYEVILLLDACQAVNSNDGTKSVIEMINAGVIISTTKVEMGEI